MTQELSDYLITMRDDLVMYRDIPEKHFFELAARKAGITGQYVGLDDFPGWMTEHDGVGIYYKDKIKWNPLTSDADAFFLACKIDSEISFLSAQITCMDGEIILFDDIDAIDDDHAGIVRLMIFISAALIEEYGAELRDFSPLSVCKIEPRDLITEQD